MHGRHGAGLDEAAHEIAGAAFGGEIDGRRGALQAVRHHLHIGRLAEMTSLLTEQEKQIAVLFQGDTAPCRRCRQ